MTMNMKQSKAWEMDNDQKTHKTWKATGNTKRNNKEYRHEKRPEQTDKENKRNHNVKLKEAMKETENKQEQATEHEKDIDTSSDELNIRRRRRGTKWRNKQNASTGKTTTKQRHAYQRKTRRKHETAGTYGHET